MTATETPPPLLTLTRETHSGVEWTLEPVLATMSGLRLESQTRTIAVPMDWQQAVAHRLERLAALSPGWDGAGARSIPPNVITAVKAFLDSPLITRLTAKPELVPTLAGGIQIEWHTDLVDLVIECDPSGGTSFYFDDLEHGEDFEGSLTDGTRELTRALLALGYNESA